MSNPKSNPKPKSTRTNNLVQHSCGYVFRLVIPEDLRPIIGKRELRYSLHEPSLLNAKRKSKVVSGKVKNLFSQLRRDRRKEPMVDKSKINQLIRNMIKTTIAEMEHEKAVGKVSRL